MKSRFCINLTKNLKFRTVRDEEKQFSQFNFSQDVIYQFGSCGLAWNDDCQTDRVGLIELD